jgi:hypothetical protein
MKTQNTRPRIANAATAAPIPMPALAPVLRPLDNGEAVAVGLPAGGVAVNASEEVLEASVVELAEDDVAEAVRFGFCDVTVKLDRTNRPW